MDQRTEAPRCHSARLLAWAGCALVAAGGAGCPQIVQQYTQPLPRVLPDNPSREQVLGVVNANSGLVTSLISNRATLQVPGAPALRANLVYERPWSFRLRGETSLSGPEVDLGSNSELFWFWVRRSQPPATYFCRHDQYAGSAARQVVPVPVEWIVQALGIVHFGADEQHQGPFPVRGGRLEMRSAALGPTGLTRVTVIDETRALVLEQHVYDRQGQRLATALLSRHARDPATGAVLPRRIDIQWPTTRFELGIDLSDLAVNTLDARAQPVFVKPLYPGYPDVDLATLPVRAPAGAVPTAQR